MRCGEVTESWSWAGAVGLTGPETNCQISLTFDYPSSVVDRITARIAPLPPSAG